MATVTPNIGLTRPGYTDDVDITVLNTNFTTIDTYIGELLTKVAELEAAQQATTANAGQEG